MARKKPEESNYCDYIIIKPQYVIFCDPVQFSFFLCGSFGLVQNHWVETVILTNSIWHNILLLTVHVPEKLKRKCLA